MAPGRVGGRQRVRRREALKEEMEASGRAGGTLALLQGLGKGVFTDQVLDELVFPSGGSTGSSATEPHGLTRDINELHRHRPLVSLGTPLDGALVRLVGESKVREFSLGCYRRGARRPARLARRRRSSKLDILP